MNLPLARRFATVALIFFTALTASGARAEIRVATLHPMMADLASEIGGSHVGEGRNLGDDKGGDRLEEVTPLP